MSKILSAKERREIIAIANHPECEQPYFGRYMQQLDDHDAALRALVRDMAHELEGLRSSFTPSKFNERIGKLLERAEAVGNG